jgi:hypothetical protein
MPRTYLRVFGGLPFSHQYFPQFKAVFSKFASIAQQDPFSIDFITNLLCKKPSFSSFLHELDSAMMFTRAAAHATPDGRAQIFDFIVQRVERH